MSGFSKKMIRNETGLTLLELTVALTLFSLLAVASLNLIYFGVRSTESTENKVEIINNLNFALSIISKSIRECRDSDLITITTDANLNNALNLPGNIRFQVTNESNDFVLQKISNGIAQDLTTRDKLKVTKLTFVEKPNNIFQIELTASCNGETVKSSLEAAVRSDV